MDTLMDKFLQSVKVGDPDSIMDCFWQDAIMISADFPPLNYSTYLTRLQVLISAMDDLSYEIIFRDSRCMAVLVEVIAGGVGIKYYTTARAKKRNNILKFIFVHFSPCPQEEQSPLAWIAKKLSDLEEVGLLRDINRLELQREIIRLEHEKAQLLERLNADNNLITTGRITGLDRRTNPPNFRVVGATVNQKYLIQDAILTRYNLKNNMTVRVVKSRPVRSRGDKETRLWIVDEIEIIGHAADESQ